MTLSQILPLVDMLPHADKFQLMQILLNKIAKEENIALSEATTHLPLEKAQHASIRDNSGFGMWADRIESTQEQLQHIRQQQWKD